MGIIVAEPSKSPISFLNAYNETLNIQSILSRSLRGELHAEILVWSVVNLY